MDKTNTIIEKRLGIPPDYQYKSIRSKNFFKSNWHLNKFAVLQKLTGLNKSTRVLDLGIGSGNFELLYAGKVKSIVGIDYNDEAINFIEKQCKDNKIKNVRLICADIRELNSSKHSNFKFDLIIIVDVIEHLDFKDPEGFLEFLKGALASNGQLCVITPNYKSLWPLMEYLIDKFRLSPKLGGQQHLVQYNKRTLTEFFTKGKFKLKTMSTFNLFSYLIPFKLISKKLALLEINIPIPGNMLVATFL